MCARHHSVLDAARLREFFHAIRDSGMDDLDRDVLPGRFAPIVRRPPELESGDEAVPERAAVIARFGLIPFWAKDVRKIKLTYNAGSETVATAKPFQAAWKKAQHCIVPAEARLWLPGFSHVSSGTDPSGSGHVGCGYRHHHGRGHPCS